MSEVPETDRVADEKKVQGLPPDSDTKRDDDIPGTAGWQEPYADGRPGGKLSPGGDNPPPDTSSE